MKNILITGGCGFIGGNFIDWILENKSWNVINLDKLTYAAHSPLPNSSRHNFYRGGIENKELVRHILEKYKPSVIVNFAAETHVDRSIDVPDPFVDTNVVGTFQFLTELLWYYRHIPPSDPLFTFIHISTDEVYGELPSADATPFTEQSPMAPNSPYAASKASAEHFVRAFHETYGLPAIITNSSNNYGPYQYPEKLIPLTIHNAYYDLPIPVFATGQNIRDWIYVEDHCKALWEVIQNGTDGEKYNIGGHAEVSVLHVVQEILRLMKKPETLIQFVPDRPGHDFRYALDTSKIHRELGWSPSVTFETGLRLTVDWSLKNISWLLK